MTPLRDALGADVSVDETTLRGWCDAAAAAWPGTEVEPTALVHALAAKLAAADPPALGAAAFVELHLAMACAAGQPAAIAHLERAYLDVVAPALARLGVPAALVDDVRATVRQRLLVAEPGHATPRIVGYAGHGRLRGLVQVSATRLGLDELRRHQRQAPLDGTAEAIAVGDVELSVIKAQLRGPFVDGLRAAMAALPARDRTLLRLHFLGGVTLEQLATMHAVHRATIVRWLAAARAAVWEGTRAHVAGLTSTDDLDELFALVQSRVELSFERLLATTGA